jgi:hypothetical protein
VPFGALQMMIADAPRYVSGEKNKGKKITNTREMEEFFSN